MKKIFYRTFFVLLLALPVSIIPALAIDFGDNSGTFTYDGECDDLRFSGPGASGTDSAINLMRDAYDCRELYNSGNIYLNNDIEVSEPSYTSSDDDDFYDSEWEESDFGDNSSNYAYNGECDDPRFQGWGMADILVDEDAGADAFDCFTLFSQGDIEWN